MLNQKDTGSGYTDHLSYGTSFLDGSGSSTDHIYTPSSILNSIYYIVLGLDGLSSPLYHNLEEKSRGIL